MHSVEGLDMRFDTWNVRSLYRAGLHMEFAKELSKDFDS
jgi:hypothetical protein